MDNLLASELLSQITSHLKNDQQSLSQLNQTSRKLHQATGPYLYKSPRLYLFSKFKSLAESLSKQNGLFVRHLDLHMVPHRWDPKINSPLFTLTAKTPNLEMLNLDLCLELTNKALIKITASLSDLRILSVDQCTHISDESIFALSKQCPYLQELYLGSTRISDLSLFTLAKDFILLTRVCMPDCQAITEAGIKELTSNCKSLRYLDIKNCYNVVGTPNLASHFGETMLAADEEGPEHHEEYTFISNSATEYDQEDDQWASEDDENSPS